MGRKPWRALWADRLRSSPKWTKLRTVHRGFWLDCFCLAKEDGRLELRPGVPLTPTDLAYEFRTRPSTIEGWQEKLIEAGLAVRHEGFFRLTNVQEMCTLRDRRSAGAQQRQETAQRRSGRSKGLRRDKVPHTEKRRGSAPQKGASSSLLIAQVPEGHPAFGKTKPNPPWPDNGSIYRIDHAGWLKERIGNGEWKPVEEVRFG